MTKSYQFFSAGVAVQLLQWEAWDYRLTLRGPDTALVLTAQRVTRPPVRHPDGAMTPVSDRMMFGRSRGDNQILDRWLLDLAAHNAFGSLWVADPLGLRILDVRPGSPYRVSILESAVVQRLAGEAENGPTPAHLETPREVFTIDPQELARSLEGHR